MDGLVLERMFMKNIYGKDVLVTGATSGIGKSIADKLAYEGCHVYGIGLKAEEGIKKIGKGEIEYIDLDVTDANKINEVLPKKINNIDACVLCAGFGIAGPAEIMPIDYSRKQMEVNYFGVLNICSFALPILRKKRKGLVIAISSVGGRIPLPMQSHYSSSKFALEAYMEALRIEMRDFNIKTVLIEPGDTKTGFTSNRKTYNPEGNPYFDVTNRAVKKIAHDEQFGKTPESVRDKVIKCFGKKNPPVRCTIGIEYKLALFLLRIFPTKLVDYILYKMYMPKK